MTQIEKEIAGQHCKGIYEELKGIIRGRILVYVDDDTLNVKIGCFNEPDIVLQYCNFYENCLKSVRNDYYVGLIIKDFKSILIARHFL